MAIVCTSSGGARPRSARRRPAARPRRARPPPRSRARTATRRPSWTRCCARRRAGGTCGTRAAGARAVLARSFHGSGITDDDDEPARREARGRELERRVEAVRDRGLEHREERDEVAAREARARPPRPPTPSAASTPPPPPARASRGRRACSKLSVSRKRGRLCTSPLTGTSYWIAARSGSHRRRRGPSGRSARGAR